MGESTIDPASLFERLRVFITAATDQAKGGQPTPAWEEAGQDIWDAGALEQPAQVLKTAGASEMLRSLAQHAVAKQNWRAAELAVGTLANFACHRSIRQSLLESAALAEFVTQEGLACEDAATAGEACRLCSTVLSDSTYCTAAAPNPWSLALTAPPTLAQVYWIATNATRSDVVHRALAVLTAISPSYFPQQTEQEKADLAQRLIQLGALLLIASTLGSWLAARAEEDEDMERESAVNEAPASPPAEEPSIGSAATEEITTEVLVLLDRLSTTECGNDAIVRHASLGESLVQLIAAERAFSGSQLTAMAVQVLAQLGAAAGVWLAGNATAVGVVIELLLGSPSFSFEEEESVAAWHVWCAVSLFLAELPAPQLAAHEAVLNTILSTEGEILRRTAESRGKLQQEREGPGELLAYGEGVLALLRARVE